MSKTFRPYDPEQMLLMPVALQDWLPVEHLAYFISDVVDHLELSAIMSRYEREERGYPRQEELSAERVDDPESRERITPRIVCSLKQAQYVVADLTYSKPNVYFEAGYVEGTGKTPVYIARVGTKLEFDVKDYPVIFFKNGTELSRMLRKKFKAL